MSAGRRVAVAQIEKFTALRSSVQTNVHVLIELRQTGPLTHLITLSITQFGLAALFSSWYIGRRS